MNTLVRSRARRRLGSATLAAGAAILLSGCYGITGQQRSQLDGVGDVEVVTDLCLTGGSPQAVRSDSCVTSDTGAVGNDVQLYVSYLLQHAVDEPTLRASGGPLEGVTFTQTSDDTNVALTGNLPSKPGFRWVSYASSAVPTDVTGGAQKGSVTARLDTEGTFEDIELRTAASWRFLSKPGTAPDPALAADRDVECGAPFDPNANAVTPRTACTESQLPPYVVGTTPDDDPEQNFATVKTSRLEVLGPQSGDGTFPTFTAGTKARVAFGQISHRADGAPPLVVPVSGASEIPGAVVESRSTLTIGSDDDLSVDVAIPASTPAGDYKVSVDAGERSGHRSTWQLIHVNAAPAKATPTPDASTAPAPAAAPATTPAPSVGEQLVSGAGKLADKLEDDKKTRALRKGAATIPFDVPTKGFMRVSLLGKAKPGKTAPVLAVGTAEASGSGPVNVKLKRTADGKKLFASGKPVEGSIVVRFWGPAGKTVSTAVSVTLD